ncbi:O-antigen ligase family protein [Elizabethkingia meningoseptica]|uniref:O-antigen ligase family protein n=1 Tax=Elizabethkingia meningoseptica TaxID=238 RepID=UPI003891F576
MLGLIILTIITTGSRTAILALLLGGLVMLFQKLKSLTYAFRVGLVVVVSIVMLWLYYLRPDSVKGRVVLWNAFLSDTDAEAFFKGKGINYTGYKAQLFLEKYLGDASLQEQLLAGNTFSPMNEYIRILVENGVLGLGLFILALVVLCYHFFIRKQTALLAACIVFMICGFSSYPLYAPGIWFLVLFIGSYYKGKEWSIHLKRKTWVAAGVIVCSVFFFVVIRITIYNNALLQWYSLQNKEDYLYNEPYFVKRYDSLYTNLNRNPLFLTDYGIKLQELSRYEKSVEILNRSVDTEPTAERYMLLGYGYEQLHQYDAAESFYKKAIQTQPKLFRSRYFLFNLYRQLGKTDMAKQEATEILLFPVKISSAEVNVIKEEVMRYLME